MTGKQIILNTLLKCAKELDSNVLNSTDLTDEQKADAISTVYRFKGWLKWLAKQE